MKIVLLLILFLQLALLSEEVSLKTVSIKGNRRTKEHIVTHISRLDSGVVISDTLLDNAQQRLMRTGVFSSVEVTAVSDTVFVKVAEKWTIIPYVNGSFGGKLKTVRVGLYDANFFGRNMTTGGEYLYYNGTHNGKIYANKSNIGKRYLALSTSLGQSRIPLNWLDEKDVEGGFMLRRRYVTAGVARPLIADRLYLGGGLSFRDDHYSEEGIAQVVIDSNRANGYNFKTQNYTLSPSLSLKLKKFNHYLYNYEGGGVSTSYARRIKKDELDYNVLLLNAQWYKKLPLNSNLCLNFNALYSDGHGFGSYSYLGGTNAVRGFNSSVFRGRVYAVNNAEFRIPSIKNDWIIVQHIFFADFLTISDSPRNMDKNITAFGGGLGIRLISPKIYSFMVRFDYGWGTGPYKSHQWYLGTSHFFLPF